MINIIDSFSYLVERYEKLILVSDNKIKYNAKRVRRRDI